MENEELKIGQGNTEAFLICDKSLGSPDAPFMQWLRSEGFTFGGRRGNFGCWWVHVNITRKQFAYGMPGTPLVTPIGNHAITIEEFQTIYRIYKKYSGKEVFVFHKNRFDYDAPGSSGTA